MQIFYPIQCEKISAFFTIKCISKNLKRTVEVSQRFRITDGTVKDSLLELVNPKRSLNLAQILKGDSYIFSRYRIRFAQENENTKKEKENENEMRCNNN